VASAGTPPAHAARSVSRKMSKRHRIRQVSRALGKVQKKLGKLSFSCIYPECGQPAILSHSQQREGQLRAIAREGLVYAFKRNPWYHLKQVVSGGSELTLSLVGIREASRFPGFCSHHDHKIFRPIEVETLEPDSDRQSSLLFLRAMSFEYAQKRKAALMLNDLLFELGRDADPQWHNSTRIWTQGVELYLVREIPFIFEQLFDMITSENYKNLHTSWVRVHRRLPLSISTCICPRLNEYYDKWSTDTPQPTVVLSIVPSEGHTDIVCSWLDYSNDDAKWIEEQMGSTNGLERIVNLLGIAESEDVCFNPDFWDSQSEELKRLISFNMRHDAFRGPTTHLPLVVRIE